MEEERSKKRKSSSTPEWVVAEGQARVQIVDVEDSEKLRSVLEARVKAKLCRDFGQADALRDQLASEFNVVVEDDVETIAGSKILVSRAFSQALAEERKKSKLEKLEQKTRERQLEQRRNQLGIEEVDQIARSRQGKNRKVQVHKKKQKVRFSAFAQWLNEELGLWEGCRVLDVAGGNGNLAYELALSSTRKLFVTTVDPHRVCLSRHKSLDLAERAKELPIDVARETTKENVFAEIQFHQSAKLEAADEVRTRQFVESRGVRQIQSLFNVEFCEKNPGGVWDSVDLVVGLHPDQATDEIVDNSLKAGKAFVVVPCCVFPKEFPHRRLDNKQVRSREELCEYLARKHPGIKSKVVESIPGPCNTVLWWVPENWKDLRKHSPCLT